MTTVCPSSNRVTNSILRDAQHLVRVGEQIVRIHLIIPSATVSAIFITVSNIVGVADRYQYRLTEIKSATC